MRYGGRLGGLSPAVFNMSSTDKAGIAIAVAAVVFLVLLVRLKSE